jgi:hypothetical protein
MIAPTTHAKEDTMAWTLKGYMTENCSCNMFCPCWFGVQEHGHGPGLV